ncbi:MAG: tetratricopeptide repeat protein [Myxococcota bacterium]|nr:tetratricopeptide repeat protein [Myxococcota bacterium]
MNLRLLSMLGLLTVAGVAPSQDAPASSESAAPSQGETATEDAPSASEAPAGSSEESPDAAASADAAQESRDPEHVAFEETMARFRAVAEAYNQEVTDVIKRRRNARLERLNIDFEEKMAAIEARMGIRRQQAIEAFERFVKRYPNDAVYTPPAMFRLAELHYEEAKQANLIAEERYEEQMELFNDGKLSEEPPATQMDLSRSIELYETILKRFPGYERNDAVQYLWAYCQAEIGEIERERDGFLALVRNYPDSQFRTEAWLRVGENYFDEDMLCEALDAYSKVLSDTESSLYDKALYKVAWTHYKLDRFEDAVGRFFQLVDFAEERAKKTGQRGSDVRTEAIQYLAISATEDRWGRPRVPETLEGCREVTAGDESWDEQEILAQEEREARGIPEPPKVQPHERLGMMFEKAGEKPYRREIYNEVANVIYDMQAFNLYIPLARKLIEIEPMHPDNPQITWNLILALDQLGEDTRTEAALEREKLNAAYGPGSPWQEANENRPSKIRQAMRFAQDALSSSALFRFALAQKYVEEGKLALAAEEARIAAGYFETYIKRYPYDADIYEYKFYRAVCLQTAAQWLAAADAFEAIRDDNSRTDRRERSAYAAFLMLQAEVDSQTESGGLPPQPDGSAPEAQEIPVLLKRMINASMRYIELIPDAPDTPRFYYNAAVIYSNYSHREKADKWYRKLIAQFPEHEGALDAARWVLNSYINQSDWPGVEAWARKMLKDGVGKDDEEFQKQFADMAARSVYEQALVHFEKRDFQKAHDEFLRLIAEDPKNKFAAQALFSAASCMDSLQRFQSAGKLYERVFNEYPEDKALASQSLFKVASAAYESFEFDRAIDFYMRLVNEYKDFADRADALYNAAVALEATEQYPKAAKAFQRYTKEFKNREDAPEVYYRSALVWEKANNFKRMKSSFDEFVRRFGKKKKNIPTVIKIYSKLSDVYWDRFTKIRANKPKRRSARRAWSKQVKAARKLVDVYADKTLKTYQKNGFQPGSVESAYAAKSQFRKLEAEYESYAKMDFSVKGRNEEKVAKALQKRIKEKKKWGDELEAKYLELLSYSQFDWSVAGLYRSGSIWEDFSNKLYDAPVPRPFAKDEMLMDAWKESLTEAAAPFEQRAVKKYGDLVTAARDRKFRNDWTRKALQSLNKFAREEWPIEKEALSLSVRELRPTATLDMPLAMWQEKFPQAPQQEPTSEEKTTEGEGETKAEPAADQDKEKAASGDNDTSSENGTIPSPEQVDQDAQQSDQANEPGEDKDEPGEDKDDSEESSPKPASGSSEPSGAGTEAVEVGQPEPVDETPTPAAEETSDADEEDEDK